MDPVIAAVENYVRMLFSEHCGKHFFFHDLSHTETVVTRVAEIAQNTDLSLTDLRELTIAAWFHDTGYLFAPAAVHEEKSVAIMNDYFNGLPLTDVNPENIAANILATKFGAQPATLPQMILCDADTYHFGTKDFLISNEKIFLEFCEVIPNLSVKKFNEETIAMLLRHRFYTNYCDELLLKGKQVNIDRLILMNDL